MNFSRRALVVAIALSLFGGATYLLAWSPVFAESSLVQSITA